MQPDRRVMPLLANIIFALDDDPPIEDTGSIFLTGLRVLIHGDGLEPLQVEVGDLVVVRARLTGLPSIKRSLRDVQVHLVIGRVMP